MMLADDEMREVEAIVEPESRTVPETTEPKENSPREDGAQQNTSLKHGPLGPGDRRSGSNPPTNNSRSTIQNLDSEDELDSSSDESKMQSSTRVAYTPLELDSDVESDLSSVGPRSRKRIPSKDYDQPHDENEHSSSKKSSLKRRFPNPDHYEDPRTGRTSRFKSPDGYQDDSLKTSSTEFAKKGRESEAPKKGDFNEVGIPIVDPFPDVKSNSGSTNTAHSKDVKSLIDRYEQNASEETLDEDRLSVKSAEGTRSRPENKVGIPLVAMVPGRSSSRGRSSSGFGSLPDVQDKNPDSERLGTPSPKSVAKDSKATHQTDL